MLNLSLDFRESKNPLSMVIIHQSPILQKR